MRFPPPSYQILKIFRYFLSRNFAAYTPPPDASSRHFQKFIQNYLIGGGTSGLCNSIWDHTDLLEELYNINNIRNSLQPFPKHIVFWTIWFCVLCGSLLFYLKKSGSNTYKYCKPESAFQSSVTLRLLLARKSNVYCYAMHKIKLHRVVSKWILVSFFTETAIVCTSHQRLHIPKPFQRVFIFSVSQNENKNSIVQRSLLGL